jgi:hypothetical protein
MTALRWSEDDLLNNTVELAMTMRWAVFHPRPARLSDGQWRTALKGHKGYPDLCICRRGVVRFRELKGYDARGRLGKLTPEQRDWGKQICPGWQDVPRDDYAGRAALLFDLWTPDDFQPLIMPLLTAKEPASASR